MNMHVITTNLLLIRTEFRNCAGLNYRYTWVLNKEAKSKLDDWWLESGQIIGMSPVSNRTWCAEEAGVLGVPWGIPPYASRMGGYCLDKSISTDPSNRSRIEVVPPTFHH